MRLAYQAFQTLLILWTLNLHCPSENEIKMLKRKGRRHYFSCQKICRHEWAKWHICAETVYKKNKGKQFYSRRYNFLMSFNEIWAYKGLFSVLIFMHFKKNLLSQLQLFTWTSELVTPPPFNLFQRNLLYTKTFSYFILEKKIQSYKVGILYSIEVDENHILEQEVQKTEWQARADPFAMETCYHLSRATTTDKNTPLFMKSLCSQALVRLVPKLLLG